MPLFHVYNRAFSDKSSWFIVMWFKFSISTLLQDRFALKAKIAVRLIYSDHRSVIGQFYDVHSKPYFRTNYFLPKIIRDVGGTSNHFSTSKCFIQAIVYFREEHENAIIHLRDLLVVTGIIVSGLLTHEEKLQFLKSKIEYWMDSGSVQQWQR